MNESSLPGHDFLAEVVQEWEQALQVTNVRTVFARFGVILSKEGGALAKMLPPFKMGLGGPLGNGKQIMSWILLEDVIGAIYHVMNNEEIQGPVNFVAPHPVSNKIFTETLAKVLNRPALLPVPEFAIKLLFGEMGEALLLSSCKVEPMVLEKTGYPFLYPTLTEALTREINGESHA